MDHVCLLDVIIWLILEGLVVVLAGKGLVAEAVGGGEHPELVDKHPAALAVFRRSLFSVSCFFYLDVGEPGDEVCFTLGHHPLAFIWTMVGQRFFTIALFLVRDDTTFSKEVFCMSTADQKRDDDAP